MSLRSLVGSSSRAPSFFIKSMAFPDSCRRRSLPSYLLVCLSCMLAFILGLSSLGSSVSFSAYTIRSSPPSALYFLQYAIWIPNSLPLFHKLSYYRNSHHPLRHLRGSILTRTILPPSAQPCQFSILKRQTTCLSLSNLSLHIPSGSGL